MTSEALGRVFGALSHASRRRIVTSLAARGGSMTAGEIADRFKHSWPTTTRHLGVLEEAGIVRVEKRGRRRDYALETGAVREAMAWVMSWAADATAEGERAAWRDLPYATMRNAGQKKG